MIDRLTNLNPSIEKLFSRIFPLVILASAIISVLTTSWLIWILPFSILLALVSVHKPSLVYFLLIASIPFSTEMDMPGGLATDFPDEPLMWWMMGIGFLLLVKDIALSSKFIWRHPITILLIVHWFWIIFCSLVADENMAGLKMSISKSWYILVFYFLGYYFLNSYKRLLCYFWIIILSAAATVLIILFRHALKDFSFDQINIVVRPFYRNHVNYACLLVCVFPFLLPAWQAYKENKTVRYLIIALAILFIAGIFFSYTRAAYIALLCIIPVYILIHKKWIAYLIPCGLIIAFGLIIYYQSQNKYLDLAPDYSSTIAHQEFKSLIEATPKGKDISTMERLYRWVAGLQMANEKLLVGFGPGNFYNTYSSYTVSSFRTYVSDNPERSSIHNYYLMTAVEQGIIGLIIFLGLISLVLIKMQNLIHQMDTRYKPWAWAILWSTIAILFILIFNDMIETDKVGSFFFLNLGILIRLEQINEENTL